MCRSSSKSPPKIKGWNQVVRTSTSALTVCSLVIFHYRRLLRQEGAFFHQTNGDRKSPLCWCRKLAQEVSQNAHISLNLRLYTAISNQCCFPDFNWMVFNVSAVEGEGRQASPADTFCGATAGRGGGVASLIPLAPLREHSWTEIVGFFGSKKHHKRTASSWQSRRLSYISVLIDARCVLCVPVCPLQFTTESSVPVVGRSMGSGPHPTRFQIPRRQRPVTMVSVRNFGHNSQAWDWSHRIQSLGAQGWSA